jgi:hypothetical protein
MKSAAETSDAMHIKEISTFRARLMIGLVIFLLAFGLRALSWHDTRLEVGKVQTAVTADYKRVAQLLREGGIGSFLSSSSPLADLNNLGHPPGYSILVAATQTAFGQSDAAMQFVQIIADALSAVLIFLIVAELLPLSAGVIAGMLAAFSPQFAWNSVLLLPDSICVLPILLAIFLLARAAKNPRLVTFLIAGALVGISCWLRANAMLLTFFVAAAVLARPTNFSLSLPQERDKLKFVGPRWRYALAVVFGTLLIVLPLTIRNAIVFHRFIPVSLGAGQTLLEGIADYDAEGKFGIPRTDVGIMKQEAEIYQRPDYYGTLFNPDGVERERARLSRGFGVIRSHPLWFAGVTVRRASSMVRLERSRLISTGPPISHALDAIDRLQPVWLKTPAQLLVDGVAAGQSKVNAMPDDQWLAVTGDGSTYGDQFSLPIETVNPDTDYVLIVPIKIARGRMRVSAKQANGRVFSSAVVEAVETIPPDNQPLQQVQLPFVAWEKGGVQILLSNEASNPPNPLARVGTIRLYELGPARFLWTRYPRFVIHGIQKIFLTAVILPLAIIGLLILIFQKQSRALVILSIVPLYFFTVQSIVHTEYRYVLAVDYFLFALVGVAICWAGGFGARKLFSRSLWERASVRA